MLKDPPREMRRKRRRLLAEECAGGSDAAAVAQIHGVSIDYVRRCCQEHGVTPPRAKHPLRGKAFDVLAALLNTTEDDRTIAVRLACSVQAVRHIKYRAIEAGIRIPARGGGGA